MNHAQKKYWDITKEKHGFKKMDLGQLNTILKGLNKIIPKQREKVKLNYEIKYIKARINRLHIQRCYGKPLSKILRDKILLRDGHKCMLCNKKRKKGLHIHHINHNGHDNSEDNLITLCIECHGRFNGSSASGYDIDGQIFFATNGKDKGVKLFRKILKGDKHGNHNTIYG